MSTSINKIHVNNTTRISLNDRFTVIQSVAPAPAHTVQVQQRRKRSNSVGSERVAQIRNGSSNGSGAVERASVANRKFIDQLERKHKLRTALKLKRRSLKPIVTPILRRGPKGSQRLNKNGGIGDRNRGSISQRLIRSNSLANLTTMQADVVLRGGRITRSNSISNLAARLGTGRSNLGPQNLRRLRIRRGGGPASNNNNQGIVRGRSRSRQRNLSISNSLTNLNRSNSRSNLRRTNSRNNLNAVGIGGNAPVQRRARSRSISRNRQSINGIGRGSGRGRGRGNGNGRFRSVSRSRTDLLNKRSVHSRLGVKRVPVNSTNKRRVSQNASGNTLAVGLRGGRRIARGRIVKRKNSTGGLSNAKNNMTSVRQGRVSRTRGRGNARPQARTRSQSRGRNRSIQGSGPPAVGQRGSRKGRSRGRGGRGAGRGINRVSAGQKKDLKKEDLDKELDQYMSTTKNSSDVEM